MSTVTLFIDDDRDRELLAEWLGDAYDVSTPSEPRVGVGTDLVVCDDASFPALKPAFKEWKDEQDPVFAPVLLVTEQTQGESFDPSEWETIDGLYVIDDVVSIPIKKAVFYRRLENLLERRGLSSQLADRFRRSEQRFERLFEGIPDPVFVLSADGILTQVNDAFRETAAVGSNPEETVRLGDVQALSPETVAQIEQAAQRAHEDGPAVGDQPTVPLDVPGGETRFVAVSAAPLVTDGRREAVVVLRDVTERRRREQELEAVEYRFEQIAEHVSEVIWLTTIDGELLYVSPGYEALSGRDPADLSGDPRTVAIEHAHPDDTDRLSAYLETVYDDPATADVHTIEYRLVDTDGQTKWIRIDTYPVWDTDEVTRIVGVIDDITDRKRRERRFNAIFNQTFQLTGLVDPDGTVLEVNERAVEYLGLDRESVVGRSLDAAADGILGTAALDRLQDRIAEAAEGTFVRYEEAVSTVEGAAMLDISIKPITDEFGDVVLLVLEARDVTDRKQRERELARQNERLEEFASIVSHDLRNPLQIIRARMGIARDTGDIEHLDAAEEAVGRMDRLIDDLLNLARHGDLDTDTESVSLGELSSRAWLSVDGEPATVTVDAPTPIRADPDRLVQLLENLFRNAVEHGSTSGQSPDDGVTVSVGQTPEGFFVADDGPGIPADERETIFDLGHTTETNGTGFGLAIVAEIVEAHDWSIDVTETDGGGARFDVTGVEFAE